MKIKIIEPYHHNKKYDIRGLTPSLGPVVIASILNRNGHQVQVISEYVTKLDLQEISEADLVGISITTYNAPKGFEIAQGIEKPIVFGGWHASLMPEECLKYGDYVIRGDGHAVAELADLLSGKRDMDISQIPNLVYKRNGQIFYNKTETKPINIPPDFSLVKKYYKFGLNRLLRIPILANASRGCLRSCSFCSIAEVYQDFIKKDTEIFIEDIRSQIKNQHFLSRFLPKIIWIVDDNFFSDKAWAKDVLRELAKLKTNYRFNIQAGVDIAYDDELLELVKKANIGFVSLGIESLNQESLDNFKKSSSLEQIGYAIKKLTSLDIGIYGLFVFGDDAFRRNDGLLVAEFVRKHKLAGALIQPLTPFPGTMLYRNLKKQGRILSEDWEDYNGKVVFSPQHMSAAELQKEIYDCYKKIYSPLRIIKYLLFGKNGFKLIMFGIGLSRYFETKRVKNYIKDKLAD